jgi:hypothetical protein
MNQTRIRLDQQFSQILNEEVDRRTVPKHSVARQDPVRDNDCGSWYRYDRPLKSWCLLRHQHTRNIQPDML